MTSSTTHSTTPQRETSAQQTLQTIVAVRSCDCGIQGPENLILCLAAELKQQHVRYVIVNLWDGEPPRVALHEEATQRGLESYVVATTSGLDPAILPRLAMLLRRLRPDVIHTHDFKSEMTVMATAPFVRAPIISSFYGRLAINSLLLKIEDWTRLITLRLCTHVFANAQAQQADLQRWRIPARRVSILPSFVDTAQITPATSQQRLAARARLGIAPEQPVIATIARLSQNKGHRYLLEALPQILGALPDLLYLVPGEGDSEWHGDGGFRTVLEQQAAALGLGDHVRFLGYYPELRTILDATDAVVSPSLREGMQVSLIEAMAAGKPIVATAIGGTPDAVLHGETGLLVPPADPAALAEAVVALWRDPARMAQMGMAARQRAETLFDTRVIANQVRDVCAKVVARV